MKPVDILFADAMNFCVEFCYKAKIQLILFCKYFVSLSHLGSSSVFRLYSARPGQHDKGTTLKNSCIDLKLKKRHEIVKHWCSESLNLHRSVMPLPWTSWPGSPSKSHFCTFKKKNQPINKGMFLQVGVHKGDHVSVRVFDGRTPRQVWWFTKTRVTISELATCQFVGLLLGTRMHLIIRLSTPKLLQLLSRSFIWTTTLDSKSWSRLKVKYRYSLAA